MEDEQKRVITDWKEILKLYLNPHKIMEKLPGLFGIGLPAFIKVYSARGSVYEQVEIIIMELLNSEQNFFNDFIDALNEDNDWLVPLIKGKVEACDYDEALAKLENRKYVQKVLTVIMPYLNMDAQDVSERLCQRFVLEKEEDEQIHAMVRNEGNISGSRLMLQKLVRKNPNWLEHFVKAYEELNYDIGQVQTLKSLINDLGCSMDEKQKSLEENVHAEEGAANEAKPVYAERHTQERPVPNRSRQVGATSLRLVFPGEDSTGALVRNPDDDCDHTHGKLPPHSPPTNSTAPKQASDAEWLYMNDRPVSDNTRSKSVSLREYQKALAEQAILGNNVIICAPTGSGKTRVAAHIIQTRFGNRLEMQDPKIGFLVPRVPLAKQQRDMIKSYLKSEQWTVDYVVGDVKTTLKDAMHSSHVIVLTPQILINALKDETVYSLTEFDMLILDECHHTMKDTPYNIIMQQYLQTKNKPGISEEDLPQVIGITASLGVGKGKREGDAIEHQMALCANLNAFGGIVTVPMKHQDELNRYTPQAEEHNVMLDGAINDPFMLCLCETIDKIVTVLYTLELRNIKELPRPNPLPKGSQQYIQWCQNLTKKAVQCRSVDGAELCRNIQLCSFYLKGFNDALDLHFKCRAIDALNFLTSYFQQSYDRNLNQMENLLRDILNESIEELWNCHKDPACTNDNLIKMEREILCTFEDDSNSRAMLNVLKRQYTKPLRDWLNESAVLRHLHLNAECFTGVGKNKDGSSTRLTHNQQENILEMFRNGSTKILVCTPEVASEGMDIVDCNLVLCYDYVKNEISKTQVKGRARKKGGRMVQFSSRAVMANDKISITKTLLMEKTTRAIQKMYAQNKQQYIQQLEKKQSEAILTAQLRQMNTNKRQCKPKSQKTYQVLCKKCCEIACYSVDVGVLNGTMYTCNTNAFRQKFYKKVVEHGGTERKEGLFCRGCDSKWGIYSPYKQITIPLLDPDAFQFVDDSNPNSEALLGTKWQKIEIFFKSVQFEDLAMKVMGEID